jgi:type I restriction enzyme S subunit
LKIGNVRWGYIDLAKLDFISAQKAFELDRFRVRKGDLLFARQGATTGRNALADDRCEGAIINYHIIRVAVDAQRCLPEWLAICFNSDLVQRQVGRDKVRGNRDGINTSNILSFHFPLPDLDEQATMVQAFGAVEASRTASEKELEALRSLKSALMSVLLTGEVRVRVDEEDDA